MRFDSIAVKKDTWSFVVAPPLAPRKRTCLRVIVLELVYSYISRLQRLHSSNAWPAASRGESCLGPHKLMQPLVNLHISEENSGSIVPQVTDYPSLDR